MADRKRKSRKPSGTRAESLLSETVFLADECLGKGLPSELRAAGLAVETFQDHFSGDTLDTDWLPIAGERGWVVLTKDKAIRKNPLEIQAVIVSRVRMFTLTNGNMTGAEMTQLFLNNRRDMGRFLKKYNAPFIVSITRSGLNLVYPKP